MSEADPGGGLGERLTAMQVREEWQGMEGGKGRAPDGAEAALKEWAGLLLRAGFWAVVIYIFVFQVSVVKGGSMQPNFATGDRLVIDKLVFHFRNPRPGDVVVFEAVTRGASGRKVHRDYIKRIIAGPRDEVAIYGGRVHVNGQVLDEPWGPQPFELSRYRQPRGPRSEAYKVPPGRYFVLGDRRGNSKDSRYAEIGFVPARQIKGKVRWRFLPFGRLRWF